MMHRIRMLHALVPLIVLAVCAAAPAQAAAPAAAAPGTAKAQFEAVLSAAYPADEPGAAVIVARGGEVLFHSAYGMAELELGIPLEPDMVLELGSITKQFTAAAIMMLAEQDKLSVGDPISKFLPDYPGGDGITVEHLLTHTSGIVSYTGIPGYMTTEVRKDVTVDELIDVFKDLPVEFAPGDQWKYNNSGYILLGAIIEKASGKSYAEFIQENIFDPLGMKNSYYGSNSRIIPRRARGYEGGSGEYVNARYLSMTQPYAAGSLLSTVEDLLRWNRGLFGGTLLRPESVEQMTRRYTLNDGEETSYGYGLGISDVRDRRAIAHGGGIFGFVTHGVYLPDDDVYVALLSNNSGGGVNPGTVGTKLAAIAIGNPFPEWKEISLGSEVLEKYVGVYQIDEETTRSVMLEDGQLFTQRSGGPRLEAFPASETQFFYKNSLSYFELVLDGQGRVTAMRMHQGGADEAEEAVKVSDTAPTRQAIELDPAIYDAYVGEYELMPGFSVTITREDDKLMVQATGQPKFELFPESETEFFLKVVDAQVTFVKGADGAVNELILHQGGRDMPGKRK